jgi:His-Xaa-Ser system protein HxsD
MGDVVDFSADGHNSLRVKVSQAQFGTDALLKACYWVSRECSYRLDDDGVGSTVVTLIPKQASDSFDDIQARFMNQLVDFELRGRIESQTREIRELLLAKAFSEAGLLEDAPQGTFGDAVEEAKPDGMFKILSNR